MKRNLVCSFPTMCLFLLGSPPTLADSTAVERGRDAVHGQPSMNQPVASYRAYTNLWKQWGLKKKPINFAAAVRDRYGLHKAPYENGGLPMGLHKTRSALGEGITTDCLACHAGRVAGQTYIGLGNASLDLQGLIDELVNADPLTPKVPFTSSNVRGTIDPVSPVAFLMGFRDPELNVGKWTNLGTAKHLCSDPPAWWLLKKKKTRNWTGNIAAHTTRLDLATLLHPFNSGPFVKKQAKNFADIHAFVLSVQAPRYPFAINARRAAKGQKVFQDHCARCHGTYVAGGTYPNKIVPLVTIKTDPLLAQSITDKMVANLNKSWLTREKGSDGKPYKVSRNLGYQAPPLDGVWATAPYLHNGSVPTVYHLLKSKARPKVFTRSYRTEKEDYDPVRLGWKINVLKNGPAAGVPGVQRRRVYDTTVPGQSNAGHLFGDKLTEMERWAVIEYLKTL